MSQEERAAAEPRPPAPMPADEGRRLEVLSSYRILDTDPEATFDRITRTATCLFHVPIALVSLIDRNRQWFKSCVGLGVSETPRDDAFCAHAILRDEVLVILDARSDPRFASNPLVMGDPYIRFYAGAPLKARDGASLGTLCVIDTSPRDGFSLEEQRSLETLAGLVVDLLELRLDALDLQTEMETRARLESALEAERSRTLDEMRAKEQLAVSRAEAASRLAAIVESSQDAIIGKTLEGRITSWNAAAESMYGYSAAEAVGQPIQMLVPSDRTNEVSEILSCIRTGVVANLETERIAKDGRRLQVSISVSPVKGPTGEITGGATIARDITHQKAVQEKLRADEEATRSIIETASDAFISMDDHGRITDWNRRAEQIFGWRRSDAVGGTLSQVIIPERYRSAHEEGLHRFLETGEGPVLDHRIQIEAVRRDGTEIPIELAIWAIRGSGGYSFNAFLTDISERKRAEQEIRASEAFKGAILNGMAEGVVVTDPDDRILLVNPAMEALAGWPLDQVQGHPLTEVYIAVDQRGERITADHPRINELFHENDGVLVSRGHGVSLLRRDGTPVPVAWTVATIRDEAGQPQGRVAVLRDITEEREIDQLKSSLVSTVSHELRTPLTMIQGFSELLLVRDVPRDRAVEALTQIHTAAERLARLIDDLLSVSRIDSGNTGLDLEPLDLRDLVGRVVREFSASQRELIVDSDEDLPSVMADAGKTLQILTNLVSNAVKYSDNGAPVRVRLGRDGEAVRVSVADEGIGLTAEELSLLFQKFFRADNSDVRKRPGTGLGLYITKNLVELQGGQMSVASERGRGSTFSFTVPVAHQEDRQVEGEAVDAG